MAERKAPQVDYVPDSSEADNSVLARKDMDPQDFNRYLRVCFRSSPGAVQQLANTCKTQLARIGKKPDLTKAVSKCPEGSENCNLQSVYRWMEKVSKRDRKAVSQIQTLHATASRRLGV